MATTLVKEDRARIGNRALVRSQAYLGGRWCDAASGATIAVTDPFAGDTIGSVPSLDAPQVQGAIDAAEAAFPTWSRTPHRERGKLLRRWFELIEANAEDLARLLTLENGKPLAEARAEISYGNGFVEFFADEAGRIFGETIPPNLPGRRLLVEHEPVGVCVAITPWNFPMAMLTRKVAPALAAGCTMVAKPASQTPLSALALAVLAEEAGIPAGVFNVVTGKASMIGDLVTKSSTVRKISFTGSTEIGAQLMAASAPTIKRLSLELGGNAPLLIFDDADLETAIETAMVAKFRNSGQSCVAANRLYVQRGIHDAFVAGFAARIAGLKVGDGFDPETNIGPLIDEAGVAKVHEHFDEAVSRGAELIAGARGEDGSRIAPPALLTRVPSDALLTREETFGPLAGVIAFDTIEQAVRLANDTPFGLASYMCSTSRKTIADVSRGIESGMVGINTGLISTAVVPFGGVKLSGLGREGSRHGLDEYLNLKYLCEAGI